MDSNIVNHETVKLAYQLAGFTHRPVEQVVAATMRDAAERLMPEMRGKWRGNQTPLEHLLQPVYDWREPDDVLYDDDELLKKNRPLSERMADIQKLAASMLVLDARTPEDIVGYDKNGLPPQ